jgi:MarR family transcriptional regulator, organic hydroperoxide resistance regulator
MARTRQRSTKNNGGNRQVEVLKLTRRMNILFRDRFDECLRPLGITSAQLHMLAALAAEPGAARSGAQISRFCQVTPQTTHALLATAEKHGWVQRAPHPENARILLATLTPEGRRIFASGKSIALRLQARMLRTLSTAEVAEFEATLRQLIANLE